MSGVPATFFTKPGAQSSAGPDLPAKQARLEEILNGLGRVLIAYSGGVDSSVLLAEAHRVLGERAWGVIAQSPSLPERELEAALSLAREGGFKVRVIRTEEMDRGQYRANGPDRCYHCKTELFEKLERLALEEGWDTLAYGAVTDDLGDVRPGMVAAERHRVRAPLLEAGLSKLEVRVLARRLGLKVWDKPQSACLASRIPHGSEVTLEKLRQVELGEAALRERFGLRVVRLRHEGRKARIEVDPADVDRIVVPAQKEAILTLVKGLGFSELEIDPRGYRRADPLPTRDQED
ncbi:MAG: ATP-dependent sacrificial sulfur transferase LarE [Candidatus Eisenbacteria bacterium]|uniref:ATP-dependent sacrificial sulfur transferase LarE n=1 Tax=Eiseniibacteriota bacterium TaxID=2212470 RepID=A0A538SYU7_UNCEI|nr:MAG: ATP-dependent sacrificial sulfur transferase LarE [Candidatus Eisenbacteria bacterium]